MTDRKGTELKVGDLVNVPCKITGNGPHGADGSATITIEIAEPPSPGATKTSWSLNSKQVELDQAAPAGG